jgi:hypothetical protein
MQVDSTAELCDQYMYLPIEQIQPDPNLDSESYSSGVMGNEKFEQEPALDVEEPAEKRKSTGIAQAEATTAQRSEEVTVEEQAATDTDVAAPLVTSTSQPAPNRQTLDTVTSAGSLSTTAGSLRLPAGILAVAQNLPAEALVKTLEEAPKSMFGEGSKRQSVDGGGRRKTSEDKAVARPEEHLDCASMSKRSIYVAKPKVMTLVPGYGSLTTQLEMAVRPENSHVDSEDGSGDADTWVCLHTQSIHAVGAAGAASVNTGYQRTRSNVLGILSGVVSTETSYVKPGVSAYAPIRGAISSETSFFRPGMRV